MSDPEAFRYFLKQLRDTNASICLQLPASPNDLRRQTQQLHDAQQHLEGLKNEVLKRFRGRNQGLQQASYQTLLRLIHHTHRQTETYKMLAAEFPIDPQGSLACLEVVQRRNQRLLTHLQKLEVKLLVGYQRPA